MNDANERASFQHPRDQIVAIMGRLYGYGMTTTSGGNLSILDSNGDMWISPGGVDKGGLTRDDIILVKADGSIEGRHNPSCEYPFHRDIYRTRPDLKVILHAHPPALVAFSVVGRLPDTNILPNARHIWGEVGFAPYEIPASEALGKSIATAFGAGHDAVLLENHGAVTAGVNLSQAFQRFETLDFCARLTIKGEIIGTPNTLTPSEVDLSIRDRDLHPECLPEPMTAEERELRRSMVRLVRRSYEQMLFTSTQGTMAARLSDGSFLVTPHGADRRFLHETQIVRIRDGKREAGKRPSRGAWFFEAIFRQHEHINAVLLAHAPNIMAFAVTGVSFDARTIPESYILLREVPMLPFGRHFSHRDEVVALLAPRVPVLLIENECVLTTGDNLLEAFDRLEVAEYSAKAVIAAGPLGQLQPIGEESVRELETAFDLP